MGQRAKVNSTGSLQRLNVSLCKFAEQAALLLDEAHTDIQRTLLWLREDRRGFWKTQCWQRREQLVQAKIALSSRQTLERTLSGTPSSCVDEKRQLARAKRRVEEAELKFKRTNAWIQTLEKKQNDFRAVTKGLSSLLTTDIPNARTGLDRMVDSLEAYFAVAPPQSEVAAAAGGPTERTTRPTEAQPLKSASPRADNESETDSSEQAEEGEEGVP